MIPDSVPGSALNDDSASTGAGGSAWPDAETDASAVNGATPTVDERPPRASESVASLMRREILSGEVPNGTTFPPEVGLAAAYGVSRPTIREALRYLEADHLISIRRGKQGGAVVLPPSTAVLAQHAGLLLQYRQATLVDIFAAKALIEPPAAAATAARRDPSAVRRLRELIVLEAEHQADGQLSQLLGERFHELLVELTGNRALRIYAAMINGIISVHMTHFHRVELERRARLLEDHRHVVDLIEVGAVLEAQSFWREHLGHFTEVLLSDVPRGTTVLDVMS